MVIGTQTELGSKDWRSIALQREFGRAVPRGILTVVGCAGEVEVVGVDGRRIRGKRDRGCRSSRSTDPISPFTPRGNRKNPGEKLNHPLGEFALDNFVSGSLSLSLALIRSQYVGNLMTRSILSPPSLSPQSMRDNDPTDPRVMISPLPSLSPPTVHLPPRRRRPEKATEKAKEMQVNFITGTVRVASAHEKTRRRSNDLFFFLPFLLPRILRSRP